MKNLAASFIFSLIFLKAASAAELYEMNTTVRALGMGNAYTAIVNDKDSLFYNPAGLAKVGGINWTIMDPRLGVDGYDVINTVTTGAQSGNSLDTLRSIFGKNLWLGAGAKMALAIPGFAFAVYDTNEVAAYLSNPAFPNMNLRYIADYGAAVGVGIDVAEVFQIGIAGKRISRSGGEFPVGLSTLGTLTNQDLVNQLSAMGTGYSIDVGTTLTLPAGNVTPIFSLVLKQVGSTQFTRDSGVQAPPRIPDELIFGFATMIDMPGINILPAVDYKYATRTDEPLGKKIHVGIEFDLPVLRLRGGLNQGYWTLGVGIDMQFLKFDAASYGVELGEYPGQHEDRRFLLQATMELGLDPTFGLGGGKGGKGGSSSGGGSRGVKPRR
ncbi:MAG: hypothetical protein ABL958_00120 [Bdellovibrionia bacterium]